MSDPADLLVDFLNSLDVEHGTDAFARARDYQAWCRARGQHPGDWQAARRLRDALRSLLSGSSPAPAASPSPHAVPVEPGALAAPVESPGVLAAPVESPGVLAVPVAFAAGGGVAFAPTDLVESVLAAAATLTLTGDWGRLKLCPADDCRWAFYDRSRNRSRVWCDMADCGNLAKVRGYRARTAR